MNKEGFSSLATIFLALGIVILGGAVWYFGGQHVVAPATESSAATSTPQDALAMFDLGQKQPNTKVYVSEKWGVGFTYDPVGSNGSSVIGVGEKGNMISVQDANSPSPLSQSIEVFTKNPSSTLAEAIQKDFLQGINQKDCFVTSTSLMNETAPLNYQTAEISYPAPTDPTAPFWQNADKCPAQYSQTNGIQYFLMNKDVPDRYLFVRIGQYSITTDGTPETQNGVWFNSIRVLTPAQTAAALAALAEQGTAASPIDTSAWPVFRNEAGYEFKYPQDALVTSAPSAPLLRSGQTRIEFPASYYVSPKTTLTSISITATSTPDVGSCAGQSESIRGVMPPTQDVVGTNTFYHTASNDCGAGSCYSYDRYAIYRGGICYAFTIDTGTGNPDVYKDGTVKMDAYVNQVSQNNATDSEKLNEIAMQILSTFKFITQQ